MYFQQLCRLKKYFNMKTFIFNIKRTSFARVSRTWDPGQLYRLVLDAAEVDMRVSCARAPGLVDNAGPGPV